MGRKPLIIHDSEGRAGSLSHTRARFLNGHDCHHETYSDSSPLGNLMQPLTTMSDKVASVTGEGSLLNTSFGTMGLHATQSS